MALEIEAVYENGMLKLERPLPFENGERIRISIHPPGNRVRKSYGLLQWTGSQEDLDLLINGLEDDFYDSLEDE